MSELIARLPRDRRRWAAALPLIIIALALLAYIGYFVVYNIYAVALFRFPFDYDQGEGFELMDTLLFSRGQWPYRDNSSYPFYSSNYPPVYHLVIVPLVWLFGPQYWTGRLVAYLGTLVTAGAIGFAVHRASRRWWLTAIAALSYFASNYVYHVGPLFRQHLFMVMFETLAVVAAAVVIDREEKSGRLSTRGWLFIMAMLLFAGYTKQLAYATVAAVFIFLFLRQPKRAVGWALAFAAVTGLIFLLLNIATDGQWWISTVAANINPFIPGQAVGLFRQWFSLHTVLILSAAAVALYQLYGTRLSVYAIWFVVAVANSVTAGKWGAGESYFVTAIAASCILTAQGANLLLDWSKTRDVRLSLALFTLIPMLYLVQADRVFHMPTHTSILRGVAELLGKPTETMIAPQTSCSAPRPAVAIPYVDIAGVGLLGRPPSPADTAAGKRIAASITAGETAAFSEEAGFNFYAKRDIVTNPTQLLNLYNNNYVDLTEMLDMLADQAFDTVVLRAQFYPGPVLDMIGARYGNPELIEMNGFVYCILTPLPVSPS